MDEYLKDGPAFVIPESDRINNKKDIDNSRGLHSKTDNETENIPKQESNVPKKRERKAWSEKGKTESSRS